ncbi:MAG: T9SS type A sorting domain-containing protein, partial [Ignavibacteriales bacterium]|nr:T9SS type A sorting domain-containing protein [Ignavibacteriales bacterium]
MKHFKQLLYPASCLLFLPLISFAQVTNLTVNGQQTGATIVQGDIISWQITLPVGGTSDNELWLDVNQNGSVDAGTDKPFFVFSQTDGSYGMDGPGDQDGLTNGVINTSFIAGLAPAKWLFVAKNNNVSLTGSFTITAMPSPAATISGTISGPGGLNKANILVEADPHEAGGGQMIFWHGLTDGSGNYTVNLGGNPSQFNPWRVRISREQDLGVYVSTRPDTVFNVTGTHTGVNFDFIQGTVISGTVTDGSNPLEGADPHTHEAANPMGGGDGFRDLTDAQGKYSFVVPPGNWLIHFTKDHYFDQWWNNKSSSDQADTIFASGAVDSVNDVNGTLTLGAAIQGRVTNYGVPVRADVQVTRTDNQWSYFTNTDDDGTYSVTVNAGSYYVSFMYQGRTIYYDGQSSPPGNVVTVEGTGTASNIDADFNVGAPPPPPPPMIIDIRDVPNDQGRRVFVRWREFQPFLTQGSDGPPFGVEKYSIWRWDGGFWTFAGEVPSTHDSIYSAVAPTLFDSTIVQGQRWTKFRVASHFSYNFYVLKSQVDSGYSVDNLVPLIPSGLGGLVIGAYFVMSWNEPQDEDFQYFAVYRSTTSDFSVQGMVPHAMTTAPIYTDVGVVGGGTSYYYKITAYDFSGNQSPASAQISSGTTGVEDAIGPPQEFSLKQNYPNPFNPSTGIAYDLAEESFVTLKIYNTLGQEVAVLVQNQQNPGRYVVDFDARNLPTGLYIYRLTAGNYTANR